MLAISISKCWPFSWIASSHTAPTTEINTSQQHRRSLCSTTTTTKAEGEWENIIYFNLLITERPLLFDSLADICHEWIHWPICAEWQVIGRISHLYCWWPAHAGIGIFVLTIIALHGSSCSLLFAFSPNLSRMFAAHSYIHPIHSIHSGTIILSKTLRGRLIQLFVRA